MTTRSQPTAKSLTVNGLRLRYLEWGSPGALPVVCVHGYTSSAEAFNAFFFTPALSNGFSISSLFSTHPSLEKRLEQLAKISVELGQPR